MRPVVLKSFLLAIVFWLVAASPEAVQKSGMQLRITAEPAELLC